MYFGIHYTSLLVSVGAGVLGDYFLKLASARRSAVYSYEFVFAAALYVVTAAALMFAMQRLSLPSIAVSYSVLTLLMVSALGALVFREPLTARDLVGMSLACAALALCARAE
jgi:small multidrug resistance pump